VQPALLHKIGYKAYRDLLHSIIFIYKIANINMGSLDNGDVGTAFVPGGKPLSWFRDGFFLTTDKSYLDAKAVNDIFDSDLMWWNKPMDLQACRTMLDNCMSFAIFSVPDTEDDLRSTSTLPKDPHVMSPS
jgi:hypothetical protein